MEEQLNRIEGKLDLIINTLKSDETFADRIKLLEEELSKKEKFEAAQKELNVIRERMIKLLATWINSVDNLVVINDPNSGVMQSYYLHVDGLQFNITDYITSRESMLKMGSPIDSVKLNQFIKDVVDGEVLVPLYDLLYEKCK